MAQDLRDVKMVDGYLYRINEDQTLELVEEKISNERIEDLQADHDCHLDELGEGHCDNPIHN